jgi:hypothetical protein
MTIENQVVSLKLAKRLKKLGVKQESLFYYNLGHVHYRKYNDSGKIQYAAFIPVELLHILPSKINKYWLCFNKENEKLFNVVYFDGFCTLISAQSEKLIEALAKMLIHLIKNQHVKPEDL